MSPDVHADSYSGIMLDIMSESPKWSQSEPTYCLLENHLQARINSCLSCQSPNSMANSIS